MGAPSNPPAWRGSRPAAPAKRPPSAAAAKRKKIVLLLFAILAVAGIFIGLILWFRPIPEPYFLAGWVDQNEDRRIPVNAWATQDREALQQLPWQGQNAFGQQMRSLLERELRNLEDQSEHPVVVYLSAHAVSDENGKVYVLAADSSLDAPRQGLPLEDVMTYLRNCRAARKLLLLDIMQPCVEPRTGILLADVAEHARPVLEEAVKNDDTLVVLCACSPGQVSLPLEDLGHSAFGHYVARGLAGDADGYGKDGDRLGRSDGRVSAQELARFVSARVDRWAQQNRKVRQTPLLLTGSEKEFPLVSYKSRPETPAEAPDPGDYSARLREGWDLLEKWRTDPAVRVPVAVYRRLEADLARSEQHWRAGTGDVRIQTFLRDALADFKTGMEKRIQERDERKSSSLAQEARSRPLPDRAEVEKLTDKLRELVEVEDRVTPPASVKLDEKEKEKLGKEKEKLTADKVELLKPFKDRPFDLAWIVFQTAAQEGNPRPAHLRLWRDLLAVDESGKPRKWSYAEIQALMRISAALAKRTYEKDPWPAEAVHDALQTLRDEQRALAVDDRAKPWVDDLRRQAAARRRDGEKLLLDTNPASWQKAGTVLRDAANDYQKVNDYLRILQDAYHAYDEAFALLPGYAAFLETSPERERTWQSAVERARLHEVLVGEGLPALADLPQRVDRIGQATTRLRDDMDLLREPLQADRLKRLSERAGRSDPAAWLEAWGEVNRLLACRWLPMKDREMLWKIGRTVSGRLLAETLAADRKDEQDRKPTAAPALVDSTRGIAAEREQGLRRARLSIALLQLERRDTAEVEKAAGAVAKAQGSQAAWQALGRELRKAWSQKPPTSPRAERN